MIQNSSTNALINITNSVVSCTAEIIILLDSNMQTVFNSLEKNPDD